jgi:hypothetical protein
MFLLVIAGCNKPVNYENGEYNGINRQILSIVDSMMPVCIEEKPLITIIFRFCDENNDVIVFSHGVPIPISGDKLVSQGRSFMGYKRYKEVYLVFFDSSSENIFEKFVEQDSLIHNEEIFQRFRVYERFDNMIRDCNDPPPKYLINEKDSLILYKDKCLFDIY